MTLLILSFVLSLFRAKIHPSDGQTLLWVWVQSHIQLCCQHKKGSLHIEYSLQLFIDKVNDKGPSPEPCGTPSRLTEPQKKPTVLSKIVYKPSNCIYRRPRQSVKMSWPTVSNALEYSIKNTIKRQRLSCLLSNTSVI